MSRLGTEERSRYAVRNKTIMLVLIDTWFRLAELAGLNVADVNIVEGRCRVMGKGSRERIVPTGGRSRRALGEWLLVRRAAPRETALFLNQSGGRLGARVVQQAVTSAARLAGIPTRSSPHVLRHRFARAFLKNGGDKNGGDVFSLQRILGHSPASLQVTRRYGNLVDEDLRAIHRKASPVDRL